jgi:5-methylcytosine-specific restriction endonuclease McrA
MSQARVPTALKAAVRERAGGRCEYCRVPEVGTFFAREPDHVIGAQHLGPTDLQNLALACIQCNRFKGPNIASVDPETDRRLTRQRP